MRVPVVGVCLSYQLHHSRSILLWFILLMRHRPSPCLLLLLVGLHGELNRTVCKKHGKSAGGSVLVALALVHYWCHAHVHGVEW